MTLTTQNASKKDRETIVLATVLDTELTRKISKSSERIIRKYYSSEAGKWRQQKTI